MTTFAERFVAEVHGKPAPISSEEEANKPDTVYEGGLANIAKNCNVKDVDLDNAEIDDSVPEELQAGAGDYFFTDGSKAGIRYHFNGTWDACVM